MEVPISPWPFIRKIQLTFISSIYISTSGCTYSKVGPAECVGFFGKDDCKISSLKRQVSSNEKTHLSLIEKVTLKHVNTNIKTCFEKLLW